MFKVVILLSKKFKNTVSGSALRYDMNEEVEERSNTQLKNRL